MFIPADCIRVFLSSFPWQSDCPLFYRLPLLVCPLSNASASPSLLPSSHLRPFPEIVSWGVGFVHFRAILSPAFWGSRCRRVTASPALPRFSPLTPLAILRCAIRPFASDPLSISPAFNAGIAKRPVPPARSQCGCSSAASSFDCLPSVMILFLAVYG